jgi:hypothetical protein
MIRRALRAVPSSGARVLHQTFEGDATKLEL